MTDTLIKRATREMSGVDAAGAILDDINALFGGAFDQMEWAEDEITEAQHRHPDKRDVLWHSFMLLRSNGHDLMGREMLYRAHCREILARVMVGEDTRPGTAAELLCVLADASKISPLTSAATGLYFRMWRQALPEHPHSAELAETHADHEKIHGQVMNQHEGEARHRLRQDDRKLTVGECTGKHHGKQVACVFATQGQKEAA